MLKLRSGVMVRRTRGAEHERNHKPSPCPDPEFMGKGSANVLHKKGYWRKVNSIAVGFHVAATWWPHVSSMPFTHHCDTHLVDMEQCGYSEKDNEDDGGRE